MRPIVFGRAVIIGPRLRAALQWWLRVLSMSMAEVREWRCEDWWVCHLFVDAASSPARCAAVLFHAGGIECTDAAPNDAMWERFCSRRDKQITGLEIYATALGLSTFQRQIAGEIVFLYSDNTGVSSWFSWLALKSFSACYVQRAAQRRVQRGPSDHNALIHCVWTQALLQRFRLWVQRVPTEDNLSDLPSRFDY